MASCDPIESPSGLACEVSRNRWRRSISSRICRTADLAASTRSLIIVAGTDRVAIIRPACPFRPELLENALDTIALFDRVVEEEGQLRHALQAKPLANLSPQKRACPLERARRFALDGVVADNRVVHARLLQVGRHRNAGDGQESDPGIVNLSGQQRRKLRLYLVADTRGSGAWWHKGRFKARVLSHSHRRRHSLDDEGLDDVTDFDVVVAIEANTALETGFHFRDVVLEPAERSDLAFVHDDVVTQQASLGIAGPGNPAIEHHASGNRSELRRLERVAYF